LNHSERGSLAGVKSYKAMHGVVRGGSYYSSDMIDAAAILDAWSRQVVGYAISRSIDARLATAALKAAIRARSPPQGIRTTMPRRRAS
jgi:transposase InsO family protein